MNERYRQELDQIKASAAFKQQLKEEMLQKRSRRAHFSHPKAALCTAFCLVLLLTIALRPHFFSERALPLLKIDQQETGGFHNLGTIGTLGDDANALAHNNPYVIQEGDTLAVYANPYSEESPYLSNYTDEELLPLLEAFAQRFQLKKYEVAHFFSEAPSSMLNSNLYLQSDIGKLILSSKDSAYLLLDESYSIDLSGDSQEEVRTKAVRFLNEYPLIDPEQALIDVSLVEHVSDANRWQIRISQQRIDPKEALVEQQLHAFVLTLDQQGLLASISCIAVNTSQPLGQYPIKSQEDALQDLREGNYSPSYAHAVNADATIAYTEIVYGRFLSDDYYLPYYKFYVLQTSDAWQTYVPYYVIAVDDAYLQWT